MDYRKYLMVGVSISILLVSDLGLSVFAEESNHGKIQLESITVTADKREKDIQDIPGSVSALNDIQIEDAGINNILDIPDYVPNFEIFPMYGSNSYQSIRGQSNLINFSPAVGTYIDDVPNFGFTGAWTSLFDIERIEVLRGPQGNLYGMNSAGGIVNIITKKPGNTFEGKASAEYGNYNLRAYKAAVSGPVIKNKLFVGLTGSYKMRDSYIEEEGEQTHEEKISSSRIQLRWTPSDETDVLLTKTQDDYYCDFDSWVIPSYNDFKIINRGLEEGDDITDNVYSLWIKHHSPWSDITSITAVIDNDKYTDAGKDYTSGGDNLKHRIMDLTDKKLIQEIRFASVDKDNRFQWLLGGFYLNGTQDTYYNMQRDTGTAGAPTGIYTDDYTTSEIKTNTFSLFGQADYTFMEKFTFTASLRYDRDEKETDFYHNNKGIVAADYEDSTTWNTYSPKVALDYRANESVMTYVSIARGYKAGGYAISSSMGDTPDSARYDPEYAISYEGGIKTNWLKNKIIANISVFYTTVDDIQVLYVNDDGTFGLRNSAEATMWGIEIESILRPISGLQIIGSFGFLETEFEKHETTEYEGNNVPFAPQFNAGLAIQYNSSWGGYIRAENTWHGKNYFDEANETCQEDYTVANARIGYEMGTVNINAYINNIFDKRYYTLYNPAGGGLYKAIMGDPLTWGVQATIRF
ncbi:TonB-dependent receptor [uncultured Desulfobacter sp.]|uniref:TonB-dependent receptor n=1 Tax=uncultured Desulfobacter sp. TaxID=240139 RepID=UPI0029F50FAA|nr:TonB-dependent receptor [uncultured Desulfobacter sp.]